MHDLGLNLTGPEHDPGCVWAIVTIAVQLIGSVIIISGRHVWLGAGILAGFTGATEFVAHRFWELSGVAEFQARNEFFEHLGLIAGLVMVALLAEERNRRAGVAWRSVQPPTSTKVPAPGTGRAIEPSRLLAAGTIG